MAFNDFRVTFNWNFYTFLELRNMAGGWIALEQQMLFVQFCCSYEMGY